MPEQKFVPEHLSPAWKDWLLSLAATNSLNALVYAHERAKNSTLAGKPTRLIELLGQALDSNRIDVVRMLFAIYRGAAEEETMLRQWIVDKKMNEDCPAELRKVLSL